MQMMRKAIPWIAIVGAGISWFALGLRFWIATQKSGFIEGVWLLLGYFTILTNIAVGLILTHVALDSKDRTKLGSVYFEYIIVVAIVIVGVIYHTLLSDLPNLKGRDLVADILLHYFIPTFFVLFWLIRPHGQLRRHDIMGVTIMPIFYSIYAFIRGYCTGWYPYFFINASVLSFVQLAINVIMLCLFFILVGVVFFVINRFLVKQEQ